MQDLHSAPVLPTSTVLHVDVAGDAPAVLDQDMAIAVDLDIAGGDFAASRPVSVEIGGAQVSDSLAGRIRPKSNTAAPGDILPPANRHLGSDATDRNIAGTQNGDVACALLCRGGGSCRGDADRVGARDGADTGGVLEPERDFGAVIRVEFVSDEVEPAGSIIAGVVCVAITVGVGLVPDRAG